jgi:hypothetical protein
MIIPGTSPYQRGNRDYLAGDVPVGLKRAFLALALIAAPGAALAETPIDAGDPAIFEQQLREMGYAPDKFEVGTDTATSVLHLPAETLAIVLGGCTDGKKCTYIALVGAFTDVKNPPADWVAKMNVNYDLIKVWTRDDGKLTYSAGSVATGMPRATFKAWIDIVTSSSDALGNEAIKAGLGSK